MKYLKICDLYSSSITLAFKGKYSYDTIIGGILTIISFIILSVLTLNSFISLINKQDFEVITSTSTNALNSFNFSNDPFLIALANNSGEIDYDERLFNIKYVLLEHKPNYTDTTKLTFETKIINLENCKELKKKYKNYFPKEFEYFDHSKYLCVSPGQNITIYGRYGDIVNGFMGTRIYVNKCNNKTLKQENKNFTCYPHDIMNERLKSVKLAYHYRGFNIDHYSSNNSHIVNEDVGGLAMLSSEISKGFFVAFSKVHYYIDSSLFGSSKKKTEFYISGDSQFDVAINNYYYLNGKYIDNDTLGFISFNMDDKIIEYYKSYKKFTDFFAELGGIYNLIIIISQTLNKYFSIRIKIIDMLESLNEEKKKFIFNKTVLMDNYYGKKNRYNNILMNNLLNYKHKDLYNKQKDDASFENLVLKKNISLPTKILNKDVDINKKNSDNVYVRNQIKNFGSIKEIKNKIYYYICPVFFVKKFNKNIYDIYMNLSNHLSAESVFNLNLNYSKIFKYLNKNKDTNIVRNKNMVSVKNNNYIFNNNN